MKKHILILGILISAIAFFATCDQSEVQPFTDDRTFRLIRIETIDDLNSQTPMYIQSFEYQDLTLDRAYEYIANGDTVSYTRYYYDDERLSYTEKYVKKLSGEYELMMRKEYLYSNNWLEKEVLIYAAGSEKIDFEFNNGQLTNKWYYDSNDNLMYSEEFIYENDELILFNEKDQNGALTRYHTYSNPNDFTLKETVYAPDDEVIRIITTSYDQNRRITFIKSDEIALWSSRSDKLQKYVYEEF